MLCQLQQETDHREGFDPSLKEFVVGSVGDHGGLPVLSNAYLFQRQRGTGDVMGESLSGLRGSGWDVYRSVDTESAVQAAQLLQEEMDKFGGLLRRERPLMSKRYPDSGLHAPKFRRDRQLHSAGLPSDPDGPASSVEKSSPI